MPPPKKVSPRTFFLNEQHQLASEEKAGGGAIPRYVEIQWRERGKRLSSSLKFAAEKVSSTPDPLREHHFFLVAHPEPELKKASEDKRKAKDGKVVEKTDFGGKHVQVFERLGLDLLHITEDGRALVHTDRGLFDQIVQRTDTLDRQGAREQARWATISSFEPIPLTLRVDADWLTPLPQSVPIDVVVELQPVLSRSEADLVSRTIAEMLMAKPGEKLTGSGVDYSGRFWFRGKASPKSVRSLGKDFGSIQSLHPPFYSFAASGPGQRATTRAQAPAVAVNVDDLPCVAVVDMGVPADHRFLKSFRRGQFYPQNVPGAPVGKHGALVASRVVFGEDLGPNGVTQGTRRCTYYDAMVADYPRGNSAEDRIDDKSVMEAVNGVRGAAPDVRVFNLSFGGRQPLAALGDTERRESRVLMQDLDNFVFRNDAVVVVASGNSIPGVQPDPAYPDHHGDSRWALGSWACGFNTLICGAFTGTPYRAGLTRNAGWPSPFTRVGPGLCNAPIPSFSEVGGDVDDNYHHARGSGVWCLSDAGLAEDHIGTSLAAPILARECALTLRELSKFATPESPPFGVLVRAFMTLVARRDKLVDRVEALAERTLGRGSARMTRLVSPEHGSAVLLWQGNVESAKDEVRVQLPIPLDWLRKAEKPVLRLVVCSNPPVSEAALNKWACRKVTARLYVGGTDEAAIAPHAVHHTYPVVDRIHDLSKYKEGEKRVATEDQWILKISYEEIAAYVPGMDPDPRQRVAFAAELRDLGTTPVDPQIAMQALPNAASMNRLSIESTAVRQPVIVKSRSRR